MTLFHRIDIGTRKLRDRNPISGPSRFNVDKHEVKVDRALERSGEKSKASAIGRGRGKQPERALLLWEMRIPRKLKVTNVILLPMVVLGHHAHGSFQRALR